MEWSSENHHLQNEIKFWSEFFFIRHFKWPTKKSEKKNTEIVWHYIQLVTHTAVCCWSLSSIGDINKNDERNRQPALDKRLWLPTLLVERTICNKKNCYQFVSVSSRNKKWERRNRKCMHVHTHVCMKDIEMNNIKYVLICVIQIPSSSILNTYVCKFVSYERSHHGASK